MNRTEQRVHEIAEAIWEQRAAQIPADICEKVKQGLDEKLRDPSVMRGLRLEDNDQEVAVWIGDLIEGEQDLIREGLR